MTTMDQIHRIRTYYYGQGKNLSEIAALMSLDWRTVRKYVDMEDFNPEPPAPEKEVQHTSKLNTFSTSFGNCLIQRAFTMGITL